MRIIFIGRQLLAAFLLLYSEFTCSSFYDNYKSCTEAHQQIILLDVVMIVFNLFLLIAVVAITMTSLCSSQQEQLHLKDVSVILTLLIGLILSGLYAGKLFTQSSDWFSDVASFAALWCQLIFWISPCKRDQSQKLAKVEMGVTIIYSIMAFMVNFLQQTSDAQYDLAYTITTLENLLLAELLVLAMEKTIPHEPLVVSGPEVGEVAWILYFFFGLSLVYHTLMVWMVSRWCSAPSSLYTSTPLSTCGKYTHTAQGMYWGYLIFNSFMLIIIGILWLVDKIRIIPSRTMILTLFLFLAVFITYLVDLLRFRNAVFINITACFSIVVEIIMWTVAWDNSHRFTIFYDFVWLLGCIHSSVVIYANVRQEGADSEFSNQYLTSAITSMIYAMFVHLGAERFRLPKRHQVQESGGI